MTFVAVSDIRDVKYGKSIKSLRMGHAGRLIAEKYNFEIEFFKSKMMSLSKEFFRHCFIDS